MSQSFDYPPEDPFIYYSELDASEQAGVILALSEACRDKARPDLDSWSEACRLASAERSGIRSRT